MNKYFADPRLNASTLKKYMGSDDDFSIFRAKSELISSGSMNMGTVVHEGLQNCGEIPDRFIKNIFPKRAGKEYLAWSSEQVRKEILTPKDYDTCEMMINNVWDNVPDCIKKDNAEREVEIYTEEFKMCADVIVNNVIYDYKTTSADRVGKIRYDSIKFGYHLQAYHYKMVADMVRGVDHKVKFVFCNSSYPYEVFLADCSETFLNQGQFEWEVAYTRFHDELPIKTKEFVL